jgi:CRISPR-associated protein Csb1
MTRRDPASPTLTRKRRCAVYTRKSTDEGLETPLVLSRDDALSLYADAVAAARAVGFNMVSEPVRLLPQDKLIHIVRESMNKALADEAEGDDAGV